MKKKISNFCKRIVFLTLALMLVMSLAGCTSKTEKAYNKAVEAMDEKDFDAAADYLDTAIDKVDFDKDGDGDIYVECLYLRADCYREAGDEDKANAEYELAFSEDQKYTTKVTSTRYLRRGLYYRDQEDYTNAIDAFKQGLTCDEVQCEQELRRNLIYCLEESGDTAGAFEQLELYVNKYPDDADMQKEYMFLETRQQS